MVTVASPATLVDPLGLGDGTLLQPAPVSRSVSGPLLKLIEPTAQTPRAELADTATRREYDAGSRLATRCHEWPFQCAIRMLVEVEPTAQAFVGDAMVMPAR